MADPMFHQIKSEGIEYQDSRSLSFDPSTTSKITLGVVLLMLFGFMLWATFAKLSSAAIAPGVIIVESKRKPIQHLEGGIVKTIHIADGQAVERGDLLITLDASQAHAQLYGLRAQWQSDLARLNRLQSELSDQKRIQFDPRLIELKDDPRVQTILDTQAKLFDKRRSLRRGEDKILNEKIAQANLDLDGLRKRYQADEQGLVYLTEQLEMHETLLETGNTSKSRLLDLKREYSDLSGNLAELDIKINRAQRGVSEAQLQDTNADFDYAKQIGEEIQQLERSINETNQAMMNAQQVLKRIEIRAPQSGVVVGLSVFAQQSVISPGEKIMEIVPQQDQLIVEALLKPEDIDVVYLGLDTQVRLSAYNFRRTPPVRGKLVHISADRITDQASGSSAYLAQIALNQDDLAVLQDVTLYPGMPAEVMILLNEKTPLDYLLSPLSVSAYKAMREI
ncbi:HlyD family type I secretion periplasmic adaptor subunit [Vibrio scophthalmi]|uniref:Membrane fusion protein (MFP) family protein n=1 Tax=Vibrio scophthalmi LMG 19158 TaxID=870967 RepID=F9RUQ0_9VIBR|nr:MULTISPECIES: HlyD family type I secretion periplasmic adaptor subunit [Vibrio]EGU30067.1 putative type I secretion protein, HlyD family [Vibrio scophthalmi LMG 19158]EGU36560.1 putative type I secretion protein, HlyD family [Vibrio sp. N418]MCY9803176.1 HlyD family type I secretion periplasmic adaptor subunit [Vibrio scophthalmi]